MCNVWYLSPLPLLTIWCLMISWEPWGCPLGLQDRRHRQLLPGTLKSLEFPGGGFWLTSVPCPLHHNEIVFCDELFKPINDHLRLLLGVNLRQIEHEDDDDGDDHRNEKKKKLPAKKTD